ncbi:MAG: hypothetical protein ACHQXA_11260, partial [Gemmatimonadales bacterium]
MIHRRTGVAFAAAFLVVSCGPVAAARHRVVLEPVLTLGSRGGPGALPGDPRVSGPLAGGRWVVWPASGAGDTALVFDSTGRYLGVLGSPESLGGIDAVFPGIGDTTLVLSRGRITFFGTGLRAARSVVSPAGLVWSAVELRNGWLALAPSAVGQATILVDRRGSVVGSLPAGDSGGPSQGYLQPAPDASVWSVNARGPLELDRWDSTGRLMTL